MTAVCVSPLAEASRRLLAVHDESCPHWPDVLGLVEDWRSVDPADVAAYGRAEVRALRVLAAGSAVCGEAA